jgi:tetratricopeptide (TPR) repeat protein
MRRLGAAVIAAVALLALSSPARAQTDPRLVQAMHSAQEGQSDSARAAVERLLAATSPGDSLYPQILYTQAMVAGSAADMRRSLQRVVVEYPTSPWADDALLRLVQMDYAVRNLESAERNLERLKLDFPATPLLPQAAYWAGRAYFDDNKPATACRWLADGMAQVRNDVEMQNRLGFLYQRCGNVSDTGAAGADSTRVASADTGATVAPRESTPPTAAAPAFRVQVAAVGSRKAAEDLAARVRSAGFTSVTTQEKGLYKVRAGEFATRAEAQAAAGRLKAKLGGSPFVVAGP